MIEITVDYVFETAAKVVAGREDYVYTNPEGYAAEGSMLTECYYVHGLRPGCIVGSVLHKMGVNLYEMRQREGDDAEELLNHLQREGIVTADRSAILALKAMQTGQDCGRPWGDAVREAKKSLSE